MLKVVSSIAEVQTSCIIGVVECWWGLTVDCYGDKMPASPGLEKLQHDAFSNQQIKASN